MKTRVSKITNGGWRARSVLECGSLLPLFFQRHADLRSFQSARGLAQSKTWRIFVGLFCFFILHSSFCLRAQGQFSIDWFKIAGGGGMSTGGVYAVSGTIGQPDAGGAMSGGSYSLTGGFWSLIAVVQTAGLPNLCITHSGNSVIISWPKTVSCTLQQNANLAQANGWATSGYTINTSNGTNSITITVPTRNLFFRLSNP
jgi:hypothetical protein